MKQVQREAIVDNAAYERERDELRRHVFSVKQPRRIHLGDHLTFLFETTDTVRYQVQEMLRIEQRSSDEDVRHELATYNELLGGPGELGCTLLVEFESEAERDRMLRRWRDLPRHLYVSLDDGGRAPALFDERQLGDEKLSSVQYLKFRCGDRTPVALGVEMAEPPLRLEAPLTDEQRAALAADLRD